MKHYHSRPEKPISCDVVIHEDGSLCGKPQGRVKSRTWCNPHNKRFNRYGDVDGLKPLPTKHTGTCAVIIDKKGTLCGAPIERLTSEHPYCRMHLGRAYKYGGDTRGLQPKQRYGDLPDTCGIIDPDGTLCTNGSANPTGKYGRLCRNHARRQFLYGDVHGGKWEHETCQLTMPDGTTCPLPHKGKVNGEGPSMCDLHWRRTRKWGDPRVDLPIDYHRGIRTCEVVLGYDPKKGERCSNLANTYGVCVGHNQRKLKSGDIDGTPLVPKHIIGDDRFRYKTNPANGFVRIGGSYDGAPCHHWLGAKSKRGYGIAGSESQITRTRLVHRRIWETLIGPIPEGHQIDHMCHNKDCFNIKHLRCMTPADHVRATRMFVDMKSRIEELESQLKHS